MGISWYENGKTHHFDGPDTYFDGPGTYRERMQVRREADESIIMQQWARDTFGRTQNSGVSSHPLSTVSDHSNSDFSQEEDFDDDVGYSLSDDNDDEVYCFLSETEDDYNLSSKSFVDRSDCKQQLCLSDNNLSQSEGEIVSKDDGMAFLLFQYRKQSLDE